VPATSHNIPGRLFFNVLYGMPAQTSYKKAVRLSVKCVDCDKTEKVLSRFLYCIIWPSFVRRRMLGGGDPFCLKFWVKLTPLE